MFPLPSPPDTLVVRQLECVCCKEKFAIAEDYPRANGEPSQYWQLMPDNPAVTQMRYTPNRSQRGVSPEPRSVPNAPPHPILTRARSQRSHINCPRCGADNRNWLQLLSPSSDEETNSQPNPILSYWQRASTQERIPVVLIGIVSSVLILILAGAILDSFTDGFLLSLVFVFGAMSYFQLAQAKSFIRWRRRFPLAQASLTVGLIIGIIDFGFALALEVSFSKALILGIACFLFTALIAQSLTGIRWIALRFNQYLRRVQPSAPNLEQRLWLNGGINILVFSFVIPLVFFSLLPTALTNFSEWLAASAAEDVAAVVEIGGESTPLVIDGTNPELLQKRRAVIDEAIEKAGLDKRFFVLWAGGVGLSSLFAVILSMRALLEFTETVNRQLPPPIYYSIANMTRVVAWEAKRSLDIPGDLENIHWIKVKRNRLGGIDLRGTESSEPSRDEAGHPTQKYVPAEEYNIVSDQWGGIVKAGIHTTRVLVVDKKLITESLSIQDNDKPSILEEDFFANISRTSSSTKS